MWTRPRLVQSIFWNRAIDAIDDVASTWRESELPAATSKCGDLESEALPAVRVDDLFEAIRVALKST
jgi:hypothetical protein